MRGPATFGSPGLGRTRDGVAVFGSAMSGYAGAGGARHRPTWMDPPDMERSDVEDRTRSLRTPLMPPPVGAAAGRADRAGRALRPAVVAVVALPGPDGVRLRAGAVVTAATVASPKGWQVSVLGWVGGDGMVVGGVMVVVMVVVVVVGGGW